MRPLENVFTEDEKMLFVQHQSKWRSYIRREMVTFYSTHREVFKSLISGIYRRTIIPFEALKSIEGAISKNAKHYFLCSEKMDGISATDKNILVENNIALMLTMAQSVILGMFFFIAFYFDEKTDLSVS